MKIINVCSMSLLISKNSLSGPFRKSLGNRQLLQHLQAKTLFFYFAGKRYKRILQKKRCTFRKATLCIGDERFHLNCSAQPSNYTSQNTFFHIVFTKQFKGAKLKDLKIPTDFTSWICKTTCLKNH